MLVSELGARHIPPHVRSTTSQSAPRRDPRRKRPGCHLAAPPESRPPNGRLASRRLSPVEKLQALYGLSLDAALEDLSYRGDEPYRLSARTSARHDVMMICAKYAIETSRERDRQRVLEELVRGLEERRAPT